MSFPNNEAQYSNRGQVPVHNARAQQKQKITSQLTRTVRCGSASRLATARNALWFFRQSLGTCDGSVALVAYVPNEVTSKFQANKLIQQVASIVGGKGGGRPESARGAGKDTSKVNEALAKARELLS